jgi:hypothetical protein
MRKYRIYDISTGALCARERSWEAVRRDFGRYPYIAVLWGWFGLGRPRVFNPVANWEVEPEYATVVISHMQRNREKNNRPSTPIELTK